MQNTKELKRRCKKKEKEMKREMEEKYRIKFEQLKQKEGLLTKEEHETECKKLQEEKDINMKIVRDQIRDEIVNSSPRITININFNIGLKVKY